MKKLFSAWYSRKLKSYDIVETATERHIKLIANAVYSFAVILLIGFALMAWAYAASQPITFTGDIEIAVDNGPQFAETLNNTLHEETGLKLTSESYNFSSGIKTIKLYGEISAPAYTLKQFDFND